MPMPHQKLPANWESREQLREKGQFWTPNWVAEAMVGYVANGNAREIFDPAVGAGAFFCAAKNIEPLIGRKLHLVGTEIDSDALRESLKSGLSEHDIQNVHLQDFTHFQPPNSLAAIVANPPYIRHHRLSQDTKNHLRQLCIKAMGFAVDGRAGYHIYFLIHALHLLAEYGRLAFIVPADTCEGIFAHKLWHWITENYRLDAVTTFGSEASPFPGIDTNAVIFFIKKASPKKEFLWSHIAHPGSQDLRDWVLSGFETQHFETLSIHTRSIEEGLKTGLSRMPEHKVTSGLVLGDYAKVLRGIATGANEFFFLTRKQAEEIDIPPQFLLPAIGRTRDVETDIITKKTLFDLEEKGRPTLLLAIDGRQKRELPFSLQKYLMKGEELGFSQRALIRTRRPWYKMETRKAPPFVFAYLGRRSVRFIRNEAAVMPLTGFLCVYPHENTEAFIQKLGEVICHPETISNLVKVGKSYGSGAIKVEPRALERLPLPEQVVYDAGLPVTRLF